MTIIHGHSVRGNVSSTYRSWLMMKNRCLNSNDSSYLHYGAKGITVCEKWMTFEGFLDDMGNKPLVGEDWSIDRIDGTKGYYKDNCRWATPAQQSLNQGLRKDNKLGHKNIRKFKNSFQVRVTREGQSIFLGNFATIERALEVRDNFLKEEKNGKRQV